MSPRMGVRPPVIAPMIRGVAAVAFLFVAGCAATHFEFEQLLQPDPSLPKQQEVDLLGALAVQAVVRYEPEVTPALQSADLFTATGVLVDLIFKYPIEQVVGDERLLEIGIFSLAHQWGCTQLLLDSIGRYEKLLTYRYEETKRKQRKIAISNVLLGLSSALLVAASANATPDQRLSNELRIAENMERRKLNTVLAELYDAQREDYEDLRLQLFQAKQSLSSYSNLLETYARKLLAEFQENGEDRFPDALRVLRAKASI